MLLRFDAGTKFTLLGKPKFVTLADAIHSRKLLELCKAVRGFDIRVVSEIFSAKLIFVSFSICIPIQSALLLYNIPNVIIYRSIYILVSSTLTKTEQ